MRRHGPNGTCNMLTCNAHDPWSIDDAAARKFAAALGYGQPSVDSEDVDNRSHAMGFDRLNDDDTDAELALQRDSGKPDEPAPSAAPPEEPTQRSAANRPLAINKVVLGVVAVIAVIGLIALLVVTYNKQKVGKSDNPTAQKAALTLLETIPGQGIGVEDRLLSRSVRSALDRQCQCRIWTQRFRHS